MTARRKGMFQMQDTEYLNLKGPATVLGAPHCVKTSVLSLNPIAVMFISIYMSFVASGPTGKIDELWCSKHSLRKPMPSSQLGLSSEKYIPTKRCIFVCWLYTVRTGFSTRAWIKS